MTCDHQTRQTAALNLDGTDAFKTKRNPSPRIETLDELRKTFSKVGHVPVEQKQDFRGLSRSSKPPKSSKLTIVRIQLFQLERRHPDDVSIQVQMSDQVSNTSGCPTQSDASWVRACKSDGKDSEASWVLAGDLNNQTLTHSNASQSSVQLNGKMPDNPEAGWVLAGDPSDQTSTHSNASQSSVLANASQSSDCK